MQWVNTTKLPNNIKSRTNAFQQRRRTNVPIELSVWDSATNASTIHRRRCRLSKMRYATIIPTLPHYSISANNN